MSSRSDPILAAHGLEPAVSHAGKRVDRLIIDIETRERARRDHEEDEREPFRHDRDDSQGYRDAMIDAGRGDLLRG